ncbi:MAG: YeeE/YedE thiosulfate transporter family protein [Methanofollis sp.]|uniref:YeeE/YedE thiosulfate transporter family protein n=1 Tax=Methanofollis sp. TaxID=2052835 RepID=UPI00260E7EA9|nr:YeeE/YedE thiosulfate transporter family protein [Methanofollis sp.]MDD4254135.1 YeeE/YedE thiosulfate transporter family protein [Methanofollis sp.]
MDWTPYIAGAGIGVLSWLAFLLSDRPLGCSTAYARASGMIERAVRGKAVLDRAYYKQFAPRIDWEVMLVLGIVIGAFATAFLTGEFALVWVPPTFEAAFGPSVPLRIVVALAGGVLMGIGARWAGGCTSGHGISGTLQMALSSWVAVVVFFASGILSAFLLYGVWP